jgi:hypothetical protein
LNVAMFRLREVVEVVIRDKYICTHL